MDVTGLVHVVEQAAIAASKWNGKNDKNAADEAATEAMRTAFKDIPISGAIVIGEGERDEAPMLFIGEKVGSGGEKIDIAVDPLEGTNLCAAGIDGAITVLAAGPDGTLLHAPDTYMDKIAAGKEVFGIDLDQTTEENVTAVAKSLGKNISDVGVLVMDRDRHKELIAKLKKLNVRLTLISDGDVMGAITAVLPDTDVDLLLGIGAAPEGVLGAVGVKNLGGFFQGRLQFKGQELLERAKDDPDFMERAKKTQEEFLQRAKEMGITHPDKKLELNDLVASEGVFVATAVTDTDFGPGVQEENGKIITHTLVLHNGNMETIRREHDGTA